MMYQGLGQILIDYCSNFFNSCHRIDLTLYPLIAEEGGAQKLFIHIEKKHDLNSLIPVYINLTLPYKSLNKKNTYKYIFSHHPNCCWE